MLCSGFDRALAMSAIPIGGTRSLPRREIVVRPPRESRPGRLQA
jgi:hypothetical protein